MFIVIRVRVSLVIWPPSGTYRDDDKGRSGTFPSPAFASFVICIFPFNLTLRHTISSNTSTTGPSLSHTSSDYLNSLFQT